jgi:enoyl-CoA hydratase/carnithine racemase
MLINRVVDDGALIEQARALAGAAARQPPGAVRATKCLMRSFSRAEVGARIQQELMAFSARLESAEFRAAAEAFLGKSSGKPTNAP